MRDVFQARVDLVAGSDALLPLEALRALAPAVHEAALAKYDDTPERRRLRDTVIPLIGRRWTEVVFLSPVHPHATWRAWRELTGRELPPVAFRAIPASDLPADAVVLDRHLTETGDEIDPREVAPLDAASFSTALEIPPRNREWLASLAAAGHSGAWFHRIPHVLTAGPVPLRNERIVDWRTPIDDPA